MSRWQEPRQISELARELTPIARPNPLVALYHWRYEIGAVVLFPYALYALFHALGLFWSLVVLFCIVNWLVYWRSARRFVGGRLRSIVVQHRLRTGFARARVCTLDGRLPTILWSKPRGDDVEVTVFCPAGLGSARIEQQRELLASACFATDVHVYRHPRRSYLVYLSVGTAKIRGGAEVDQYTLAP